MKRVFLFLFILFLFTHFIDAQENKSTPLEAKEDAKNHELIEPPNPLELERGWRHYLEVDPHALEEHIPLFLDNLRDIVNESPLKGEETEQLVNKIALELETLNQLKQEPPLPTPQLKSFQQSYPLDSLFDVSRILALKESELKASREAKERKIRLYDLLRRQRDRLFHTYETIPNRTAKKLLLGLEIIEKSIAFMIAQQEIDDLDRRIRISEEEREFLQEELAYAKNHIDVSDSQQIMIHEQKEEAEQEYAITDKALQQKEEEVLSSFSVQTNKERTKDNGILQQELLAVSAEKAQKNIQLLIATMEETLLELFRNPEQFDLEELNTQVQQWNDHVKTVRDQADEWMLQAKEAQQAAGRALSLIDVDEQEAESIQLIEYQKKIVALSQKTFLEVQKLQIQLQDATLLLDMLNARLQTVLGRPTKILQDAWLWIVYLASFFRNSFNRVLFSLGKTEITFSGVLYSILIVIVSFWLARLVVRMMTGWTAGQRAVQRSLMYRISRLVRYCIIALGIVIALSALGFDFSSFVLIIGALGVGLGFGLQDIFHNFLAGIILLGENHLKVGDFIELQDEQRGKIMAIHFRSTTILTNDGVEIIVPNKEMIGTRIVNWTLRDSYRRVHVPFVVAYQSDKDKVVMVVKEAAKQVSATLQRSSQSEPNVFLQKLGDHGLEFELIVWVHEKATTHNYVVMHQYLWAIESALRENNISIPYPQMDVHFE